MESGFTDEDGGVAPRIVRGMVRPAEAWRAIDVAPIGVASLIAWLVPFAAIGPAAQLAGRLMFGLSGWGGADRPSLALLSAKAVAGFASGATSTALVVLVLAVLAPPFGGVFSPIRAAKLVIFSAVPVGLAGVFALYPPLAGFAMLGIVYAIYLFWIGLPIMLRVPAARAPAVFAVTLIVAVALWMIAGTVTNALVAPAVPMIGG